LLVIQHNGRKPAFSLLIAFSVRELELTNGPRRRSRFYAQSSCRYERKINLD
jgi:hypothetical protein